MAISQSSTATTDGIVTSAGTCKASLDLTIDSSDSEGWTECRDRFFLSLWSTCSGFGLCVDFLGLPGGVYVSTVAFLSFRVFDREDLMNHGSQKS
jgi:hypothetical protein